MDTSHGELNEFETFDKIFGHAVDIDPYAKLAELRAEADVHRMDLGAYYGLRSDAARVGETGDNCYLIVGHDAASQVLRNREVVSSSGYSKTMGVAWGRTMIQMDDPEHRRYRNLIQSSFAQRTIRRWEETLIAAAINERIDRFAPRGEADLISEFSFPYPTMVISGILGLPAADLKEFHREAIATMVSPVDPERARRASEWLHDYFAAIVPKRRGSEGPDIVTILANAELDGEMLDDEEIINFLRFLLPAGAETTYRGSGNLLFALLTHTDQLDAVRADRSLVAPAIEEALRWEAPFMMIARKAKHDFEVSGTLVPADAIITVCLGAANRDPRVFPDPDRFDIFRESRPHLAFAAGAHTCIGMHLARIEMAVALNAILDRLHDLRLDTADGIELSVKGLSFRSPSRLPVRFTPELR
jgi:cytochrome P450